jgi:MAC/Perforin domain/Jacalin-like lectin domain
MQRFKTVCWCLSLLLFTNNIIFAQQLFYLDNEVAKTISATTFDPTQKAVMFFSSNTVFYYPLASNKTVTPEWFTIDGMKKVDAALEWDEDNSLFFDGTSYRMFNHSTGKFASDYIQWPGLPVSWNNKLDGAVKWDKDLIVFFYNEDYLIYSIASKAVVSQDKVSNWNGWPAAWSNGIDDAFNPGDGFIYFIRAGEIMPYSTADKTFFIPKKIVAYSDASNPSLPKTADVSNLPGMKTSLDAIPKKNDDKISSGTTPPTMPKQETVKPAISGCVTGLPAGSGFREIQTPIDGDRQGGLMYDNLPKGYHISEIKVFTSKIWGKTVISGIQSILLSPQGKRAEQSVLGRKTITENSFVLDDDECITGINGTKNGESGNYIYSLQIITSKRSSQLYGERATETGRQPFRFKMPSDAVFNGFTGSFNTNMTGIGIKYYGNDEESNVSITGTVSTTNNNSGANTSVSNPNKEVSGEIKVSVNSENNASKTTANNNPVTNEYLDNYEDYTPQLNNDFEFSVKTMPGIEWLGAGFDILKFDPLNPNEPKNKKSFRAIVLTNSGDRAGNTGQYIKPYGSRFNAISSGSDVDSNAWVSSYKSFANSFNISVTGSVKVPEMGGGSQSGSYAEMNNSSLGSESIYYFNKIFRRIHDMELMQTWSDVRGQKYRQKLDGSFRADVAALPVLKGSIPSVSVYDMKKGQSLPGGLEQLKFKYVAFIEKYGTHYTSRVAWGGQYVARTEIKRSDYERSRMSKQSFQTAAEATIKKVKVGGSVEWGSSEGATNSTGKSVFRRQTYVQGGNGQTDQEKWEEKVDNAPSPVEMTFTPYADLLTKEMFPTDADIENKSRLLAIFTEKYLVDNMRPPTESKDDFFRPLPDLAMPGNLSVTNSSWLVLKFSVKYELNGQWKEEASGSFSAGMSRNVEVPVDAKNITLKVEYFTGWLDNSKLVFEKTFATPELKCYKVTGTLFSQSYNECDK